MPSILISLSSSEFLKVLKTGLDGIWNEEASVCQSLYCGLTRKKLQIRLSCRLDLLVLKTG